MSAAYAVVLISNELRGFDFEDALEMARKEAIKKFEKLAKQSGKKYISVYPHSQQMSARELHEMFPNNRMNGLTGYKFIADIT